MKSTASNTVFTGSVLLLGVSDALPASEGRPCHLGRTSRPPDYYDCIGNESRVDGH